MPKVAAPKRWASPVEQLLSASMEQGTAVLAQLAALAVGRLVADPRQHLARRLFTDLELRALAAELAAARMSGDLLARALLQDQAARARKKAARESARPSALYRLLEGSQVPPLQPEAAIDFFRRLVPTLGTLPPRLLPDLRRQAFTLAVATDTELLKSVQSIITAFLGRGEPVDTPAAIGALLDAAGVAPKNPQYAEMVFRTNAMDSYNQGLQDELAREVETFPVWLYSNPDDSRSRPTHAARDGNYYPTRTLFAQVRGTDAADVINCRCTAVPIDKWDWAERQARGAKLAVAV
ncbi:MAG: phage minor head protein [Pseudomonas sp.]